MNVYRKTVQIGLVAVLLLSMGCNIPHVDPPPPGKIVRQRTMQLRLKWMIRAANALYEVHTAQAIDDSIDYLEQALEIQPRSAEALWKMSRNYQWKHDWEKKLHQSSKNKNVTQKLNDHLKEYSLKGLKYAKQGFIADGQSGESYYFYTICLGLYIQQDPSLDSVVEMIRRGKMAAKLVPRFDYAGPHRLLGYIYLEAPVIFGGDMELSLKHFKKAIELAPNFAENLLGLSKFHLADEEPDEAKTLLLQILRKKDFQDRPDELHKVRWEAANLLKKIGVTYPPNKSEESPRRG